MIALEAFLGATRLVPLDGVIGVLPQALREGANYTEVNACV